ncbi:MAG TPA: DUF4097 family beta strand repeat-containing protein [Bryobacteraceae bacterium]|jgi:hypothetical protein
MKTAIRIRQVAILTLAAGLTAGAQAITIPFSGGTSEPTLRVTLTNGGVEVSGYDGKEVTLETASSSGRKRDRDEDRHGGLHRIDIVNGFSVSQDSNVITIHGSGGGEPRLRLQVPFKTNLEIRCANCSETRISDVSGDVDVNITNGGIRLTNVSGGVLAHSLNSNINATFDRVPQKPISLSTLNGGLEVIVPGDTKADLNLKTSNGKIYTDFDVRLAGGTLMQPGKGLNGTINGGGVQMRLNSFNGSIYVRRKS